MTLSRLRNALSFSLLLLTGPSYALPLAPQYSGLYQDGNGANSHWVQVADEWRGSVYGNESWGTGIWGLDDHALVMGLAAGDSSVVQTLHTRVDQINFSDQRFIDEWSVAWSTPLLAPIFDDSSEAQDNWASTFWGYIAIPKVGSYNFGVLYDDGFRFSLFGAGEQTESILQDGLNPRDRLGFSQDLQLSPGLYGFQLDAYERLEAGAVQLAWFTPDANDWTLVPKNHLFTNAIPEPSAPLLVLIGLAALGLSTRRQKKK